MKYFDQDFSLFFQELANNNHKEWFHSQKKRYEQKVKAPFLLFLNDFIKALDDKGHSLPVTAKDCVLRINRDIRFAKDKSPYNLHVTAFVSAGGRKNKSIPGIFFRFSGESVGIMIGSFGPSKEQLLAIRKTIAKDVGKFRSIIENDQFKTGFGEIKGEAHKRIPPEFKAIVEKEPLILNKQFYFVAERELDLLTGGNLMETMLDYWEIAQSFNEYLGNAIKQ